MRAPWDEAKRLASLIDPAKVIAGGKSDRDAHYLDPTLLYPVTWDDKSKRPTNRAFRISLTRENVCPLTGKLRSTNEDGYGSFRS